MSFLKLLLFILVLLFIFRVLPRYIAPWLIRRSVRKFRERYFGNEPNSRAEGNQAEGRITIHRVGEKKGNDIPKDLGEYIDYEELNNQKPTDEHV